MAGQRRRQPAPVVAAPAGAARRRWPFYRLLIGFLMGCWAERLALYLFGARSIPPLADVTLLLVTCVVAGFVYLAAARLRNELSRSRETLR